MIQESLSTPSQIQQVQELQKQNLQTGYQIGYETVAYQPIPIQLNSHLITPKILLIATPAIATQSQNIKTIPQKHIIRVPFLPRSVPTPHLMKQSSPIENGLVKNSNPNTVLQDLKDSQENLDLLSGDILTKTHYYSSEPIVNKNRYQILYPITTTTTTENCHQTQPLEQSKSIKPNLTLASMAGIQLAGSDESLMEMSGATPPIATVEEINVPVFIDEYLQQLTQTSTTTAADTFITNSTVYNNNNINNNYIKGYTNISLQEEQTQYQEAGEEESESFGTLDFDIQMIAENNNKIVAKIENINNSVNNNNNNTNNNTMNYFYCNSDANIYNNHNSNYNTNTNFNSNNISEAMETKEEPQYLISPGMVHYNLSEDTGILSLEHEDIEVTEEAIDISSMHNDNLIFSDVFCSSQNDPMLTDGMIDNFSQKIIDAEPVIPNTDYDAEYALCIKQQQIKQEDLDIKFELSTTTPFINTPAATPKSTMVDDQPSTLKRRRNTSRGMEDKRRKLNLNTSAKNIATVSDALSTPDVVNIIADWGKQQEPLSYDDSVTTEDIVKDLIKICDSMTSSPLQGNADTTCWTTLFDNNTNSSSTIINNNNASSNDSFDFNSNNTNAFTENPITVAASPDTSSLAYTEEDPPYTPQSVISSTNHTGDFTTSPSSPALYTSTTTATKVTSTQSKKRGRPSKEHSDKPDPARLENLPEAERKKAEDRAKNNEASRLSRLKNKLKEEAEIEEANRLTERNIEMKEELERLNKISAKLKRALQRRHFRTQ